MFDTINYICYPLNTMWEEKRKYKRLTTTLPINYEVLEIKKKEFSNTICKDISEGGLKLLLKDFYPPRTKMLLKVNIEEINKMIETVAEVAWSSNVRFSDMFLNGLQFLDLDFASKKLLNEYISMKEIVKIRN